MIRVILAILGILCIWAGISCTSDDCVLLGILLLLPGVITILVKIIKAINVKNSIRREIARREFEENAKKQQALAEQCRLFEHFKNSPLTQEVIYTICNKNPSVNIPERIEIFDNCIRANLHGHSLAYDFASHRVYSFKCVIRSVSTYEDLQYIVKPQIAMAEAMNALMGYKYEIRDQATVRYNDEEDYHSISYLSNSVVLVLKSTLPNRNF